MRTASLLFRRSIELDAQNNYEHTDLYFFIENRALRVLLLERNTIHKAQEPSHPTRQLTGFDMESDHPAC